MYNFSEIIEKEFVEKVLPIKYSSRGILVSEGFAFCSFCISKNVNLILESGVYKGQSTRIWLKFFQNIPVISVDKKLREEVKIEFKQIENSILVQDDAKSFFPSYISKNPEKRIGVFIDGPKGEEAIELLEKCFSFKNVLVAGMHDVHKISFEKPNITRKILDDKNSVNFYTDNEGFIQRYSYLDSDKNMYGKGDEEVFWSPGKLKSKKLGVLRNLGSYGPTVAFMIRN